MIRVGRIVCQSVPARGYVHVKKVARITPHQLSSPKTRQQGEDIKKREVKECKSRSSVVKRPCVNVEVRAVCVVGVRRTVVGRNLNLVKIERVCIIKKVKKKILLSRK